jgi:hypothetical protein
MAFALIPDNCVSVRWRPRREDPLSEAANLLVTEDAGVRESLVALASCALRPGSWSASEIEEERRVSALFERMERTCPGIFRGQTAVTEKIGTEWSRSYAGLEARLETHGVHLVLAPYFKLQHQYLGTRRSGRKTCRQRSKKRAGKGPPDDRMQQGRALDLESGLVRAARARTRDPRDAGRT